MAYALITGASSGIGAAFARELAANQTDLILVARSEDKLESLAQELRDRNSIQAQVIPRDLTAPGAIATLWEQIEAQGWQVDQLINNAGFGDVGAFTDAPMQRQLSMVQLNIAALVELTYRCLPAMQHRRQGSIINLSSIAAFQPMPYWSVYAASKAFVLSFSEALWAENHQTGVKVLALCPGPTESNFFQVASGQDNGSAPTQMVMTPAEDVVKEALKALQRNQSSVVTGGVLNQVIANVPRFLPREAVVKLVEQQFKPDASQS